MVIFGSKAPSPRKCGKCPWSPATAGPMRRSEPSGLMVNRSVSWADWDPEARAVEFGELKALDFDLNLTGFDAREIDAFIGFTFSMAISRYDLRKNCE